MTAKEKIDWHAQFKTSSGRPNKRRLLEIPQRLCVWCVVDDEGHRILAEEDVEQLGEQRADVIERIANVAQRLCGMMIDTEAAAKNSGTTDDSS